MTEQEQPAAPAFWMDLTVEDAPIVRDFYAAVVGWVPQPLNMGEYDDFVMNTPEGAGVAGICHARGDNADLPAQWLVYLTVADLDASLQRVTELGGAAVTAIKGEAGSGRYCVIRDPAGAVITLYQPG